MLQEEHDLVEDIGDIYMRIIALPEVHRADIPEAELHIHALQNLIFVREGYRQHNVYKQN